MPKADLNANKVKKLDKIIPISQPMYLQIAHASIKDIEKDMIMPDKGGVVLLQSDIAFNAFDLVVYLVNKYPIKHYYASTYSISRKAIESMIYLHDAGQIEQLTLLISESMIKRNPATIDNLHAMVSSRSNIKVLYAWSHAKINLLQTHEDDYFVLEGSGNLSDNAHFEQYVLINDKKAFEYRKQLFDRNHLKKYSI
jgi:hypothetical protein